MTYDELCRELLVERFGKPVPEYRSPRKIQADVGRAGSESEAARRRLCLVTAEQDEHRGAA